MKTKTMILTGIAALFLSTVSALAASDVAIDTLSLVTNYEKEEIVDMIESGIRPSQIAFNLDLMDEFHDAMFEYRQERIQYQVDNGRLTQEEADLLLESWTNRHQACLDLDLDGQQNSFGGMRMGRFFSRQNKGNQ